MDRGFPAKGAGAFQPAPTAEEYHVQQYTETGKGKGGKNDLGAIQEFSKWLKSPQN